MLAQLCDPAFERRRACACGAHDIVALVDLDRLERHCRTYRMPRIGEPVTERTDLAALVEHGLVEEDPREGRQVMDYLRDVMTEIQEETGDIFNLEATPAEGTSYRLCMLDKDRFPEIVCANEAEYLNGAAPYYTNSSQLQNPRAFSKPSAQ